jgi:uncharacterized protein
MRIVKILLVSILLGFLYSVTAQNIPNQPSPPRLVTDMANILQGGDVQRLEQKLRLYNDSTSTQIAVVTVPDLQGYDISQYAIELGAKWGVGDKKFDNGIVILVAPRERKTFIATGYGVEEKLTDAQAKRIVEQIMLPQFRQGNYIAGIDSACDRIFQILTGMFTNPGGEADEFSWVPIVFFLLFLFIFFYIGYKNQKNGDNNSETISGRGVRKGGYGYPMTGGWYGDFRGGGGPFSGGGSSGGGFGGFGGGGFGGGGAGGGW